MTSYGFKYGAIGFLGGVLVTLLVVVGLRMYTDVFTSNQPVVATNTNAPIQTEPENLATNSVIGSKWYLQAVDGVSVVSAVYIEFMDDATVNGFDGCNNFRGTYTLTGDTLDLSPLVSTLKFCADLAETDAGFLTSAESFATAEVIDDMLVITGTSGTFTFTATEPTAASVEADTVVAENGLVDSWDLAEIVVNGESTEIAVSTTYSFTFAEDGTVNGAICNTLNGTYETGNGADSNTDTVTMKDFSSTRKQCTEPDGIMDLEDNVLTYLADATRYEIDGATLSVYFGKAEDYMTFTLSADEATNEE